MFERVRSEALPKRGIPRTDPKSGERAMDTLDPQWRKSSRSGGNGGACVEVGQLGSSVLVRDSNTADSRRATIRPRCVESVSGDAQEVSRHNAQSRKIPSYRLAGDFSRSRISVAPATLNDPECDGCHCERPWRAGMRPCQCANQGGINVSVRATVSTIKRITSQ